MTFHLCSSSSFISAYYFATLKKKKPVYLLTSFILFPMLHYYKHCSGEKCGDALLTLQIFAMTSRTFYLNFATKSRTCTPVQLYLSCSFNRIRIMP